MTPLPPCVLCERIRAADGLVVRGTAAAMLDAFPVSVGHSLVVPRRHEARIASLSPAERRDVWDLAFEQCEHLRVRYRPDGFNLGLNDGPAAGQTIDHCHLHVIPRYSGDVADPRGGVRWVVPDRAAYWESP